MSRVHTLVAEDTSDFIDPVKAADNEPLQVELSLYTKVHIYIERIVMCLEGSRRRAYLKRQQYGRIHFKISQPVEIVSYFLQYERTFNKGILYLRICDKIEIALSVTLFLVLEPVPLFGKREKRF